MLENNMTNEEELYDIAYHQGLWEGITYARIIYIKQLIEIIINHKFAINKQDFLQKLKNKNFIIKENVICNSILEYLREGDNITYVEIIINNWNKPLKTIINKIWKIAEDKPFIPYFDWL